jgi:HAD superfamily hydrolase (TIGR01509 family)
MSRTQAEVGPRSTRWYACDFDRGRQRLDMGEQASMHGLIFDLDGTLVDTVYGHVLAWQVALAELGVMVNGYRLHRHVGSSGDLIVRFAQRETGHKLSREQAETVHRRHGELFRQLLPAPRPLPGAVETFRALREAGIPYAIATASYRPLIDASLEAAGVGQEAVVVDGSGKLHGKPEPDLFLASKQELGTRADDCIIIGDAIWDHVGARRAGMLSVGVLTGGYGEEELYHAGAFRVYRHLGDLLENLDELGILL